MVAIQKFQTQGPSTIHRLRGLRMHAGRRRVCGAESDVRVPAAQSVQRRILHPLLHRRVSVPLSGVSSRNRVREMVRARTSRLCGQCVFVVAERETNELVDGSTVAKF